MKHFLLIDFSLYINNVYVGLTDPLRFSPPLRASCRIDLRSNRQFRSFRASCRIDLRSNRQFRSFRASCRIRTNDPEITNHVLWPTELKRLIKPFAQTNPCETGANLGIILQMQNFFTDFFKYLSVFLCIYRAVFQLQPAIPLLLLQKCRKSFQQITPILAALL